MTGPRVRQADRDAPFDMLTVEPGQYLQLFELFVAASERAVQAGQLFARGHEPRRTGNGPLKGRDGVLRAAVVPQTQTHEVVGVGHLVVQLQREIQRLDGRVQVTGAVLGERGAVSGGGGAVVDAEASAVDLSRAGVSLLLVEVSPTRRAGGWQRVQVGGGPEILGGGLDRRAGGKFRRASAAPALNPAEARWRRCSSR